MEAAKTTKTTRTKSAMEKRSGGKATEEGKKDQHISSLRVNRNAESASGEEFGEGMSQVLPERHFITK